MFFVEENLSYGYYILLFSVIMIAYSALIFPNADFLRFEIWIICDSFQYESSYE